MRVDDFRHMRRGKQIAVLNEEEGSLLEPVDLRGEGCDRALLLLHGFSSSPAVYRFLIPQLRYYDALVCPVLPAHGSSIADFAWVKAEDWVAASRKSYEALSKEYKKVDVLGLSLGGLLACILSQKYSIHHLYLLAPALKVNMNVSHMIVLAKILSKLGFQSVRNKAGDLRHKEHTEIAFRKLPLSSILEMLQFQAGFHWVPPTCPTDLFLGSYDHVVLSHKVEKLFAPLPNVRIHWLENSAHVLPLDNDLDVIVQCMNQPGQEG